MIRSKKSNPDTSAAPSPLRVIQKIVLEDDIPMPERRGALANMKIGQSYFIAGDGRNGLSRTNFVRKKHGWRFQSAKVTENGVIGVRVWRRE